MVIRLTPTRILTLLILAVVYLKAPGWSVFKHICHSWHSLAPFMKNLKCLFNKLQCSFVFMPFWVKTGYELSHLAYSYYKLQRIGKSWVSQNCEQLHWLEGGQIHIPVNPRQKKNRRFSHAAVPLPYTLVYQLHTRCRTCIYNLPTSHQVTPT